MIKTAPVAYLLSVGLLVLAGCTGSNQQESPTPSPVPGSVIPATATPGSSPAPTTPTLVSTPSPAPTPTETTPDFGLIPNAIVSLLPKDAIRAILEPEFISGQSAEDQMDDIEHVIGVSINGDARAYPIRMLSRHEIVNDVVGGESVAVTW